MSKKTQNKKTVKKDLKLFYLLLGIITFIVYANSLNNEFVFDDESVVLGDPTITNLGNIPKYFTGEEGFHRVIGRYYRPVVSASYAIDYSLWKFNAFGFHLTNILIHILNTLLVFKLLLMIFRKYTEKNKSAFNILFLCAVVFGVHAIHTEAVTWVSGRTDSLSFTFFALAFIYYLKYKLVSDRKYFYFTLLFYVLSLFAKEMAITFPVLIILYDFITDNNEGIKNIFRKYIKIYSALIFVSFFYMLWRWFVLKDVPERLNYNYFVNMPFVTVIYTMLTTFPVYFKLLFIPVNLLYHYSGFLPYQFSLLNLSVILSILFILLLIGLSIYLFKKYPYISFSLLLFIISLLPVLNIVPTMNFMAERFLYIPSLIVPIILAELIFYFWKSDNSKVVYSVVALVILFYSYQTFTRNMDWKNNDTLFMSAEGMPGTVTYVNIGNIYANQGKIDTAETYYRRAIDLRSETLLANNNLGKVFLMRGNFDSAYFYMHKAHLLDSLSPEPMFSLAQLFAKSEKLDEAIFYLEKIQKIVPGYMRSNELLQSLIMQRSSAPEKQIPPADNNTMLKISQLETLSYQAFSNKKYEESIKYLKELILLRPDANDSYLNNIGLCYLELKNHSEAEKYFKQAISKNPASAIPYNNLGKIYEVQGKRELAKQHFAKAVELDPNNMDAKNNLNRLR